MPLDTRDYIAVIVGSVTTTSVLLNGYWQRRQMRQIEAYKSNPDAGLMPPAHPVWAFIKAHYVKLLCLCAGGNILLELLSFKPASRFTIFSVGFNFTVLLAFFMESHVSRIYDVLLRQAKINAIIAEALGMISADTSKKSTTLPQPPTE